MLRNQNDSLSLGQTEAGSNATLFVFPAFVLIFGVMVVAAFQYGRNNAPTDPPPAPKYNLTVTGNTGHWMDTLVDVHPGDIVQASGTVFNQFYHYENSTKLIPFSPDGIRLESIEGHTPYLSSFPMFALLGRINEGTPFHISKKGTEIYFAGRLELMPNTPYWEYGLEGPGFANYNSGNFSIHVIPAAERYASPELGPSAPADSTQTRTQSRTHR